MNPETEQYESIRRLLVLKRHEAPPPGYFDGFSVKVIARIQAQEMARVLPWWQRLLSYMEDRPLLAGASGVACCGMLLCGLSLSQILADARLIAANGPELENGPKPEFAGSSASQIWGASMATVSFTPNVDTTYSGESSSFDLQLPNFKSLITPASLQSP